MDRWTNTFSLTRNFEPLPSSHGDDGGTYDPGLVLERQRIDDYLINTVEDVGTEKFVASETNEPTKYKILENEWHKWGYKEWTKYVTEEDESCGCDTYDAVGVCIKYKECPIPYERKGANHHDSNYTATEFVSTKVDDFAKVIVPYNFQNTTEISTKGANNSDYVFAGDTITVDKANIRVGATYNPLTKNSYATIVRKGKAKLLTYVVNSDRSGSSRGDISCESVGYKTIDGVAYCTPYDLENGTDFNKSGNLDDTVISLNKARGDYQVYDASAGDYMCFSLAVWPADSGAPDNIDIEQYSSDWFISTSCKKIAKKPFFGVEGGSMYTAADVTTTSMKKTNILKREGMSYGGKISGNFNKKYFGSFIEQSLFGIREINGLASGSGYLGWIGIDNDDFCKDCCTNIASII